MAKIVPYSPSAQEVIAFAIMEYREWLFGKSIASLPTPGDENLANLIYEALKQHGKID